MFIHLTEDGKALRRRIQASAEQVEQSVRRIASDDEWAEFQRTLALLVEMNAAQAESTAARS